MSPATPPRLPDYLQHIALAIQRIQRYVAGLSATAFAADDKTQDAVLRSRRAMYRQCRQRPVVRPRRAP